MAHSIGSIREMLRQYREELTLQPTRDHPPAGYNAPSARVSSMIEEVTCNRSGSLENEELLVRINRLKDGRPDSYAASRKLCWHTTPTGNRRSSTPETCSCKLLPFQGGEKAESAELQGLDRRAAEVLRRRASMQQTSSGLRNSSRQAIEAGEAFKDSLALVTKSGYEVDFTKELSSPVQNSRCPSYGPGSVEKVQGHMRKNCQRTMEDVARNFEEIERILGESRFNMEQTSVTDLLHNTKHHSKVARHTRVPDWEEFGGERRLGPYEGPESGEMKKRPKRDEDREVAAIKAAMKFLNKGTEHSSNLLSDWLLGNPKIQPEWDPHLTPKRPTVSEETTTNADSAYLSSNWNTSPIQVLGAQKMAGEHKTMDSDSEDVDALNCNHKQRWQMSKLQKAHSDGHWLGYKSRPWTAGEEDSAAMLAIRGSRNCVENDFECEENHSDSMDSLAVRGLDKGVPVKSNSCWNSLARGRPSSVQWLEDSQRPHSAKTQGVKRALEEKSILSMQSPVKYTQGGGQRAVNDGLGVPNSGSRRCSRTPQREDSDGLTWSEDEGRQSAALKKDILSALESPRRIRASPRSLCGAHQYDAQGRDQRTQHKQQLSSQKTSSSPTSGNPQFSFAGSIIGSSAGYCGVLATLEQHQKERFCQTSSLGSERRCISAISNGQKNKYRHSGVLFANPQRCPNGRSRGAKDKECKSPAWVHRLHVRKPPKWRTVAITHSRSQMPAATFMGGTVVVEELDGSALRHNWPTDATLVSAVKSSLQIQETRSRGSASISSSTTKSVDGVKLGQSSCLPVGRNPRNNSRQAAANLFVSATANTRSMEVDGGHTSHAHSAPRQIVSGMDALQVGQGAKPGTVFVTADREIGEMGDGGSTPSSYGRVASPAESALPRVAVKVSQYSNSSLATQHVSRLHEPRSSSIVWPELDSLISEVIQDWLEKVMIPSAAICNLEGNKEACFHSDMDSVTRGSVTTGGCNIGPTNIRLSDEGLRHESEAREPASGNHEAFPEYREMEDPENRARNAELVEVDGKNSVAAFASLVQFIGLLQEADAEEDVVREFEADETVRLLLEKLQFYETKIRALKRKGVGHITKPLPDKF